MGYDHLFSKSRGHVFSKDSSGAVVDYPGLFNPFAKKIALPPRKGYAGSALRESPFLGRDV